MKKFKINQKDFYVVYGICLLVLFLLLLCKVYAFTFIVGIFLYLVYGFLDILKPIERFHSKDDEGVNYILEVKDSGSYSASTRDLYVDRLPDKKYGEFVVGNGLIVVNITKVNKK